MSKEKWVIETLKANGNWELVSRSFDRRKSDHPLEDRRPLKALPLEECIAILTRWYAIVIQPQERFMDADGRTPKDWLYRLVNKKTKEVIPGELFK